MTDIYPNMTEKNLCTLYLTSCPHDIILMLRVFAFFDTFTRFSRNWKHRLLMISKILKSCGITQKSCQILSESKVSASVFTSSVEKNTITFDSLIIKTWCVKLMPGLYRNNFLTIFLHFQQNLGESIIYICWGIATLLAKLNDSV